MGKTRGGRRSKNKGSKGGVLYENIAAKAVGIKAVTKGESKCIDRVVPIPSEYQLRLNDTPESNADRLGFREERS